MMDLLAAGNATQPAYGRRHHLLSTTDCSLLHLAGMYICALTLAVDARMFSRSLAEQTHADCILSYLID